MVEENTTKNATIENQSTNSNSPDTKVKAKIVQRRVQTSRSDQSNNRNASVQGNNSRQGGRYNSSNQFKEKPEFDSQIISMGRVTKVTGGGKRMRMSVFVIIGDKKGNIGFGNGKALDIRLAQEKAVEYAKRHMIKVNLLGNTIPHELTIKLGAAKIWMKPATPGTGIIAGGPVRKVLEMAGVKDVLTKQIGTSNKIANAHATIEALRRMRK